jgi:hypothetical protein
MFRLTFRDRELERSYCMQNDYMYKSSLFCITGQLRHFLVRSGRPGEYHGLEKSKDAIFFYTICPGPMKNMYINKNKNKLSIPRLSDWEREVEASCLIFGKRSLNQMKNRHI